MQAELIAGNYYRASYKGKDIGEVICMHVMPGTLDLFKECGFNAYCSVIADKWESLPKKNKYAK